MVAALRAASCRGATSASGGGQFDSEVPDVKELFATAPGAH